MTKNRNADETLLSSTMTVAQYKIFVDRDNREELSKFIQARFYERYFLPIERSEPQNKHGFSIMAVSCLVIETLEAFYQGRPNTIDCSGQMFSDFFRRDTPFRVFAGTGNWFYKDIRCGILHESETRRGWRILRKGPLLDMESRQINATKFIVTLKNEVGSYAAKMSTNETLWGNFKTKMEAVCNNCRGRS